MEVIGPKKYIVICALHVRGYICIFTPIKKGSMFYRVRKKDLPAKRSNKFKDPGRNKGSGFARSQARIS